MEFKKVLVIMAMITLFVVSYANSPVVWEQDGIGIRQGTNIEWSRAAAPIGEDKVIFVWSDTRISERDLWAQAIDKNGVVWTNNEFASVRIDDKTDRQEDPVVIGTSDGNAIIAWIDFHWQIEGAEEGSVMAQKISSDGNLMWEKSVPVCMTNHQISLNIVPNNDGGAIIIWHDMREGSGIDIYGMHLNADGEPYSEEWTKDGLPLASGRGAQHYHTLWEDGHNGAILAHVNEVSNVQDLHVKRISPEGKFLWERELAADENIDYANARVQPFGDDTFGFAYTDTRDGFYKIYVQIIDMDGKDVWKEPVPVDKESHGLGYDQKNPRVVGATDSTFVVVWEDYRARITEGGENISDIYVQAFDTEGNHLWGDRGLALVNNEYDQLNPRMESNGKGGVLVVWDDAREGGHPNVDVYIQEVTQEGIIVLEENGRAVAQIPGEAFAPLAKYNGGNLFVSWGDMRNGSIGIYCQAYDEEDKQIFQDNGLEVYWGLSGDAIDHNTVVNGDYIYIVWQDTRYAHFGSQIKVQKVDKEGNILFDTNGISLTNHSGAHQTMGRNQSSISAVSHHQGGIAVTWRELRGENELVYTQAIGPEGEMLWDNDGKGLGLRVTTGDFDYSQDNPTISRRGNSYIIAWDQTDPGDDFSYARDIFAQKIENGERKWGEEGIEIAWQQDEFIRDHYIADVIGGEYFVWRHYGISGSADAIIYAKRIDENGQPVGGWGDYGIIVCDYPGYIQAGITSLMTDDGLTIFWRDERSREGIPHDASIYGQLFNEEGENQWQDNGLAIADYSNDQVMINAQHDDGYVYLGWRDARIDPGAQDVSFQKIDLEGNPQWGKPSPFAIKSHTEHDYPTLAKVGDGVLVAWENNYGELGSNLHMQIAWEQSGYKYWKEEGEILCAASKRQTRPKAIPFDDQHAFIVWADGRSSGKEEIVGIYSQLVNMYIDVNIEDTTLEPSNKAVLHANYPNPFNPETKISFSLPHNESVNLNIYNTKGQLVKTVIDNEYLETGNHSIIWKGINDQGKTVGSGVYFYKLESENTSQTKKMLLLK